VRTRLVLIFLLSIPLLAGCSLVKSLGRHPQEAEGLAKTLAGRLERNPGELELVAQRARVSVAVGQQSRTELRAGNSAVADAVQRAAPGASESEAQVYIKGACKVYDVGQYADPATSDEDRRLILRSQGETEEAKIAATISLARDFTNMKNGTDLAKFEVSLACLTYG